MQPEEDDCRGKSGARLKAEREAVGTEREGEEEERMKRRTRSPTCSVGTYRVCVCVSGWVCVRAYLRVCLSVCPVYCVLVK